MSDQLIKLRDAIRQFAAERDWGQFHSPKNLAMALTVETAELLENFQWLTEEESETPSQEDLVDVRKEFADIFIYLVRISDKLDVDLIAAAHEKIAENAMNIPSRNRRGATRSTPNSDWWI